MSFSSNIGYAKRHFTLSVTTGELSYCLSSHNPVLRGTIPLALAALNIDYSRREFILDSGADIWHLRAPTDHEFDIWKARLEAVWLKATEGRKQALQDHRDGREISSEWKQVEGLVNRLEMMKEFVNGMVKDVAQEAVKSTYNLSIKKSADNLPELSARAKEGKAGMKIFRKKERSAPPSPSRDLNPHSTNTQGMPLCETGLNIETFLQDSITPKLASLDQNLTSILASFQSLLSSMRLTAAAPVDPAPSTRVSMESLGADDWFDAQSIAGPEEGLITVVEQESESDHGPEESSEDEDDLAKLREEAVSPLLTRPPTKLTGGKELYPLGEWHGRIIKRRTTLPTQITIQPPSLLAFLRKNVCHFVGT